MKSTDLRSITNRFQDVQLVSLQNWSMATEFSPRDSGGPFMVCQKGYDPNDLTMKSDEFVLGRCGKWLSVSLFLKLPVNTRRAEFIYGTAAEVIGLMQSLPGNVSTFHPGDSSAHPDQPAAQDELNTAFTASKQQPRGAAPPDQKV